MRAPEPRLHEPLGVHHVVDVAVIVEVGAAHAVDHGGRAPAHHPQVRQLRHPVPGPSRRHSPRFTLAALFARGTPVAGALVHARRTLLTGSALLQVN